MTVYENWKIFDPRNPPVEGTTIAYVSLGDEIGVVKPSSLWYNDTREVFLKNSSINGSLCDITFTINDHLSNGYISHKESTFSFPINSTDMLYLDIQKYDPNSEPEDDCL